MERALFLRHVADSKHQRPRQSLLRLIWRYDNERARFQYVGVIRKRKCAGEIGRGAIRMFQKRGPADEIAAAVERCLKGRCGRKSGASLRPRPTTDCGCVVYSAPGLRVSSRCMALVALISRYGPGLARKRSFEPWYLLK